MLVKRYKAVSTLLAAAALLGIMSSFAFAADAPAGVQVHGYMQNRVYLADGASAEFRSERISISALAPLPDESNAYVELYYHPWTSSNGLYAESAYYDTGLGAGRVRVGKGRRMTFGITPAYPNRKTSNYGLVSEAFTQDRIQGVQYMIQKGALDAGISVHTAYRLGIRNIGEIPGDDVRNNATAGPPLHIGHIVPHLSLRDPHSGSGTPVTSTAPNQLSRHPQFSGRLGGKWKSGLKAGVSYSFAHLDARDRANLNTAGTVLAPTNPTTGAATPSIGGGAFTGESMRIFGLDAGHKFPCGLVLQGEFYDAKVSNLRYGAWNGLIGYEMKSGWKFFARYAKQDMDIARSANPLTWDTQQVSISLVQPLRKGLWLQYEYEINTEDTDTGLSVPNNIFFVELFTGF